MIGSPCCLEADHDEIFVELSSSSRRKEGLPPGHRGGRGEQPVHPRGGGGTPSPLVGWAGGRWPVGAQSSFCTFSPELLQLQKPDLTCTATSSSSLCRSSLGPAAATAAERRYTMALSPAAAIGANLPRKSYVAPQRLLPRCRSGLRRRRSRAVRLARARACARGTPTKAPEQLQPQPSPAECAAALQQRFAASLSIARIASGLLLDPRGLHFALLRSRCGSRPCCMDA